MPSSPLRSAVRSAARHCPHTARTRREIKIVDKDLKDSEIDKIIESGKAQDVIKEALISDNLKNVVQVIEERHLDILKLEHQVRTPRPCKHPPLSVADVRAEEELFRVWRASADALCPARAPLPVPPSLLLSRRMCRCWRSTSCSATWPPSSTFNRSLLT